MQKKIEFMKLQFRWETTCALSTLLIVTYPDRDVFKD